jgi:hypothetical protein
MMKREYRVGLIIRTIRHSKRNSVECRKRRTHASYSECMYTYVHGLIATLGAFSPAAASMDVYPPAAARAIWSCLGGYGPSEEIDTCTSQ